VRCTPLDVCFTSMVILALGRRSIFPVVHLATSALSRLRMSAGDLALVGTGCGRAGASIARTGALGGVLRQPPKPALVSRRYCGLPL